jgi:hypothetical protein
MADTGSEPPGHRVHQRRGDELVPAVLAEEPWIPCPYRSRGCRNVSSTLSVHRTSSVT